MSDIFFRATMSLVVLVQSVKAASPEINRGHWDIVGICIAAGVVLAIWTNRGAANA